MKKVFVIICACLASIHAFAVDGISAKVNKIGGCEWQLFVSLNNDAGADYCAFQMDFVMPPSASSTYSSAVTDRSEGYNLMFSNRGTDGLRVVGYSPNRSSIQGTDGEIFSFSFNDAMTEVSDDAVKPIVVKNVRFSDVNGVETVMASISVDVETGVVTILDDEMLEPIYTLQGVRIPSASLRSLKPGMYVVNGRKYLVK